MVWGSVRPRHFVASQKGRRDKKGRLCARHRWRGLSCYQLCSKPWSSVSLSKAKQVFERTRSASSRADYVTGLFYILQNVKQHSKPVNLFPRFFDFFFATCVRAGALCSPARPRPLAMLSAIGQAGHCHSVGAAWPDILCLLRLWASVFVPATR